MNCPDGDGILTVKMRERTDSDQLEDEIYEHIKICLYLFPKPKAIRH